MTLARTLDKLTRDDIENFTDWRVFASENSCHVFAKGFVTSNTTGKRTQRVISVRHTVSNHDAPLQQWRAKFAPLYQEGRVRDDTPDDAAAMALLADIALEALKHTTDADLRARVGFHDGTTVDALRERIAAFSQ